MDRGVTIGDEALHILIRTLLHGIGQLAGPIPAITEIHLSDSIVFISDSTLS